MDIEQLYEIAAKELEVKAPRKGLYAQAFSEALGDQAKAHAIYMRLRVEQIKVQIEQRETEERRKAEEVKRQQELEEWRRSIAKNPRPSDYVAALKEEGFRIEELSYGYWAIERAGAHTIHIHGTDRLRETTCLLLGKEWTTALKRVQAQLIEVNGGSPAKIVAGALSAPNAIGVDAVDGLAIAGPWRRFWARHLDEWLYLTALLLLALPAAIASPGFAEWVSHGSNTILFALLLIALSPFVEATLLTLFRTTPGKALLGVRVRSSTGDVPFSTWLSRSYRVLMQGVGFGLPLVNLVTMLFAAHRLRKRGVTAWDEALGFSVRGSPLSAIGVGAYVVLVVVLYLLFAILNKVGDADLRANRQGPPAAVALAAPGPAPRSALTSVPAATSDASLDRRVGGGVAVPQESADLYSPPRPAGYKRPMIVNDAVEEIADTTRQAPARVAKKPSEPAPPPVEVVVAPLPRLAPPPPPQTGKLVLAVSPWGEVYVDGKLRGTTPPLAEVELPAGRHRVEIRNATQLPYHTFVELQAGQTQPIRHSFSN